MGEYVFAECSRLISVTFSEGLTSIPQGTFYYCGLKQITLPLSIKTIEGSAFTECHTLKDVYYAGSEADRAQITIKGETGNNKYIVEATWHYASEIIINLTLPSSLTAINSETFIGLPPSTVIYIPSSVQTIAENAFNNDVIILCDEGSVAYTRCKELGLIVIIKK